MFFAGTALGLKQAIMLGVSALLIWLALKKEFEPLLLIPIGFGGILANVPVIHLTAPDQLLGLIASFGLESGLYPLLIFVGVGAMTDFGPLIAHPKVALLGAAAQFGIFATLLGALLLSGLGIPGVHFDLREAASIGIIGGADGPTSIYLSGKFAPHLMGAIAVAAYSYMALVPIIQPPIMRWLTSEKERQIVMRQLRPVSPTERIVFPLLVTGLCLLLLPAASPLIGALMFGNLLRESGQTDRLARCASNELINIMTILLGLSVGAKLEAGQFLTPATLGILLLGLAAFAIGTAAGVLLGKAMNALGREPINPLIGAAGVSAMPMSSRVVNLVGQEAGDDNYLLMHAMGANLAGSIGSAVAAGALLALLA